jgi:hypothetical protein
MPYAQIACRREFLLSFYITHTNLSPSTRDFTVEPHDPQVIRQDISVHDGAFARSLRIFLYGQEPLLHSVFRGLRQARY